MTSKTKNKFSPEVRERAVRMVLEHEAEHASRWAVLASISAKIGGTAETLRLWMRRAERGGGASSTATLSATGEMAQRLKALERENREPRQANEILRKASAYFAQASFGERLRSPVEQGELDRRFKP